jgi:cytochrome P450
MNVVPNSLPRAVDPALLSDDPLAFLADARERYGDAVVIREGAPLFSPGPLCPGVVALFGSSHHRQVLTDTRRFVSPESIARALALPGAIVNLNRSLHSMNGRAHQAHKASLAAAITPALLTVQHDGVVAAIHAFADHWREAESIPVFAGMRRLVSEIGAIVLFGAADPSRREIQAALDLYFDARRLVSSGGSTEAAVEAGTRLDSVLSAAIAAAAGGNALAARLARELGDEAARAHLNVLFMSIAEPVTVSLTWLLLILSQRPALRDLLRAAGDGRDFGEAPHPAMERTILECLRLLSPNALMVRVTSRAVDCAGARLPPGCEIVLAPFLSHRDPAIFRRPKLFRPIRWARKPPPPFEYLPFGAGVHACIGRKLALAMVATIAGELLARVDPVLTQEQSVDWRIDITFRPRFDVDMTALNPIGHSGHAFTPWYGPVAEMIQFQDDDA